MSYNIQQQIKNNATDIRKYVEDLYDWEQKMEHQEKSKKNKQSKETSAPIRGKADIQVSGSENKKEQNLQQENQTGSKNQQLIRDQNSIKDYYKAWDKFDVDQEIESLEQKQKDEEQSKFINPYESMQSTQPRAAPKTQIKINSQRSTIVDINSLKDKANLSYQSLDYKTANELYTQCINQLKDQQALTSDEKLLFANIYSNRAMTNIKLQEYAQAEIDSTSALTIDANHVKSYLRRGTARKKLKKIKEAHEDFKKALQVQPDNKEAQKEIALIETALNERKQKALQGLILDGKGDEDHYDKLEIQDISDSDISESDDDKQSDEDDDDDDEEEEDVPIVQNRFSRLSIIDKPAPVENQDDNKIQDDKKRSILIKEQPIELDNQRQHSYHLDEVPDHSILKNSHDLGHLVKNIDSKLIKHEEEPQAQSEEENHTVKFKGAEVPTQTFTPRHNLKPRNSILKNSPLVAENFHAQIKDIDGRIIKHHSKFKDDERDPKEESQHEVHFKKNIAQDAQKSGEHHRFVGHSHSPKKHILKHNLEDENEVEQLHNKYFQEKPQEKAEEEEVSFAFTHLKNIDGKPSEHNKRSPRHKPQFKEVKDEIKHSHNTHVDDDDDDKKVHFGQVQNLGKAVDVPRKEAKPRHSILKSQGNQNNSIEIQQILKLQEEQKAEDNKIDNAIEIGKQKIKEVIIEQSAKQEINSTKFMNEWNHLKSDKHASFKYLMQANPQQLVNAFKEGLELHTLKEIFETLNSQYSLSDIQTIKDYVAQIPNSKRFKLSIGLFTANDKKDLKELIQKLSNDGQLNQEDLHKTNEIYKIK
ncbi:hypothetical protein ABPG72_018610 [Tetrahymena utriculariae]